MAEIEIIERGPGWADVVYVDGDYRSEPVRLISTPVSAAYFNYPEVSHNSENENG